ncbi:peroxin 22-like protein [Lasiosphaeria miniovina]|uniref:Peroxin 22-like protein n=1 Tax=Lasiosphaeria miniovina TaxID=1954250 RepID=A0AA40A0F1_9PEZI|nr:peroxin 22-like protein [Lasiosphaeria miniovina]KAK0706764.1 peroxin 22-like protein [Lasiosphaeria miniovina]
MSSPYDRYDRGSSRRRGVWGHWVPLVLTVTVATVGVAAWIWSQRKDENLEDPEADTAYQDLDYDNADYGDNPAYGASDGPSAGQKPPSFAGTDPLVRDVSHGVTPAQGEHAGSGWGAQVSGALRRTPSPQQFLDSARKTVAAGVTAAGAVVGGALAAIREEDKIAYADHETWSEEADAKKDRVPAPSHAKDAGKRRKKIVIVVSAENFSEDADGDGFHEHASLLSHIPRQTDFSKNKIYVLIYAPNLKDNTVDTTATTLPPASLSSSFSNIDHAQAQTPGDETKSPLLTGTNVDPAYAAVYAQAQALVEKDSMVLTFTTPNGHAHILRHIQPDVIYLQESLAGDNGSVITNLQTWLRHDVILVVGAEGGHGGLADSDSEAEKPGAKAEVWWQKEERVGRGRGVVVVDGMRVHDDWQRRVLGKD